jgi:hypothetical protein
MASRIPICWWWPPTKTRPNGPQQRSKRNESEAEQRMKLIESEILRVRSDSEQIEERTKQIESETEQLRRENARERAS